MRSHHTVDPSHCCTTMTLPGEVEHCFGNLSRLSSLSFLWNSLAMVSMGLSRISSPNTSLFRYPKWGVLSQHGMSRSTLNPCKKNLLFRYLPSIAVITNSQTKCGNFFQIYQDKMWGEDNTGTGREGS